MIILGTDSHSTVQSGRLLENQTPGYVGECDRVTKRAYECSQSMWMPSRVNILTSMFKFSGISVHTFGCVLESVCCSAAVTMCKWPCTWGLLPGAGALSVVYNHGGNGYKPVRYLFQIGSVCGSFIWHAAHVPHE
eukprot:GHUV01012158.1.p1 GENE.GHUV01012158.1~~GHUV01012158.1.p1  ORF type:complete len:135 (+),score=10.75 GHUV01012158.1:1591-1995(+)